MYSDLFVRVLNISLISCYTIVVVMVVRALILRWERKYAFLLWFVVFVNLCIPFRISGPFSLVPTWIADFDIAGTKTEKLVDYLPNENIEETVTAHHYYTPNEGENGVPGTDSNSDTTYVQSELEKSIDYLPNENIEETVTVHHYYTPAGGEEPINGVPGTDSNDETTYYINDNTKGSLKKVLALVWGSGIILLAAVNIRAVLKLRGRLKSAESLSGEDIKKADGIDTPFLWGLFSPTIYLPRTIDEEEYTYIIAHESYHRKRKDYILKPLFFMIAIVHWFNPLVWAAYLMFVRDMEISCDEAVIANADEDIRKKYAESLLKYAARQNGYVLTPITFGEPSLKCRIQNVLHYKERNVILSAFVLCSVIVIMTGLVFKPQQVTLSVLSGNQGEVQMMEDTPIMNVSVVDHIVDKKDIVPDKAVSSQVIKGIDGENLYTKILMASDRISDRTTDFRTFSYSEEETNAYVMAGDMDGDAITGSLWFVEGESGAVQLVMQNITMTDTQIETIWLEDTIYGIINYQIEQDINGRILPFTTEVLSTDFTNELMSDIFGEKRIGDAEGTIICNDNAYLLIDAKTVVLIE